MRRIVVLCDDLLFATRISDAVRRAGGDAAVTATGEAALAVAQEQEAAGVIVGLAGRTYDGPHAVAALRAALPRVAIIGFCGHLDLFRQEAGRRAGCTRVVPNGAVEREAEDLAAGRDVTRWSR